MSPRFSLVTAVYDVGRYLDAYIASVDAQTFPADRVQIIVVDDGSTDDSPAKLAAWAARRPEVEVVTKPNGGQASARNLGLEHVIGEWVSFPDPDDILRPNYLSEVDAFLRAHPETPMVATRRLLLADATGEVSDTHPLRMHFAASNQLRYLDECPNHFHGSAPAAFFSTERIAELGLRFSEQVRPNFEDGHFCSRYLLSLPRPAIAFVASAEYLYRKRHDSSSTLQTSRSHPERYTQVLRYGYLALLHEATAREGVPPRWLQNFVLYELSWYFTTQDAGAGTGGSAPAAVSEEFHELLGEITEYLEPDVIAAFSLRSMRASWRFILQHSYAGRPWHQPYGWIDRIDRDQRLVRLRYHYLGPLPEESFSRRGVDLIPVAAKSRPVSYHGRDLLWERIVWLPSRRPLQVRLDGVQIELTTKRLRPPLGVGLVEPVKTADALAENAPRPSDRAIRWLAERGPVRRRFGDAWVLMDRIHDAGDSGEQLFRYLRKRRRKINAWFVVERGTPDYLRLRREGYRRVVAHGSVVWKLLMLNAKHLISSHADLPVMRPPEIVRLARPRWRFTFLQHGVIKDDLSGWLNPKAIDLFVVSTKAEQASIAGEGSPYVFTDKEVQRTGLPRFDRLRQIGRRVPMEGQDLILLTPTWRQWLLPPLVKGSQRRTAANADFAESDFARQWLALLHSPELAALAAEQGLTVGFLPHPNLQQAMAGMELPPGVLPLSYAGNDVKEYFARAAVLVTDYSSIAFNAAYIDRPVVYFQFDADRLSAGDHVGRPGYFDYRRDGFGPVTGTLDEALAAIAATVRGGRRPAPEYARRVAETFGERDGRCSRRVTEAIVASTRQRRVAGARPAGSSRRAIAAATRRELADLSGAGRAKRPAQSATRSTQPTIQ